MTLFFVTLAVFGIQDETDVERGISVIPHFPSVKNIKVLWLCKFFFKEIGFWCFTSLAPSSTVDIEV